ncbi:hypothetical protein PR202_gb28889 [Eleusine coracana subsp. coracana]|uniref:Pentatricopeptide repeat-containing protein n=1 Tax=Eleusine coracana subsp. coracana TaxID=191504 RepID=A0AAV5FXK0_ELECO|nr:hypothetical protein PR202_gb28889 [Eleusine coracana subsp. coracana]
MAAMRLARAPATATLAGVPHRLPTPEQPPPRHPNTAHLNAQLTAYGRRGRIQDAQQLFDRMPHRDVITWTALLTAYSDVGVFASARFVFDDMPRRNVCSWNALLSLYLRAGRLACRARTLREDAGQERRVIRRYNLRSCQGRNAARGPGGVRGDATAVEGPDGV